MANSSGRVTPIRQQYLNIKRQYRDAIVLFRLGDFYETFDEDAKIAARELEIVLTSRNVAKGVRIPMAGIPHHAVENYLTRLIARGYHVAICEQIGNEPVNGLVPRQVVRVVTPGTVIEPGMLDANRNNYLAAALFEDRQAGFAFVDITTGEFYAAEFLAPDAYQLVRHELTRVSPAELLLPEGTPKGLSSGGQNVSYLPCWQFDTSASRRALCEHFEVSTLAGFGIEGCLLAIRAAGALLRYLRATQATATKLLTGLATYTAAEFMQLDAATRRNLELTETIHGGQVRGSLLGVLDLTVTSMGGRLLRQWIGKPLLDLAEINARLEGVASAQANGVLRAGLREALRPLCDLERLVNRVPGGSATPRDVGAIRDALGRVPGLQRLLEISEVGVTEAPLRSLRIQMDPAPDLVELLRRALVDELPASLDKPGVVRPGWSADLDEVAIGSSEAREWIAGLELVERRRTGIKSLKVGYNKIFGYYIEVTKANVKEVPEEYIRKQTLVNAERYITPALKEYEALVLNAEERMLTIERRVFAGVCAEIGAQADRVLRTARVLAQLDVLTALAEAAARQNYARPEVVDEDVLEIQGARHPVVEKFMPAGERFVQNDCFFEPGERVWVITGPNMSGKSTFLRQIALCALMAQIGSFVPAASARIGLVNRIFTRIGAQDEIHSGQSTFMVEMVETANILHHATPRSLLILDEIGRGTSTYDGLSLAWAIIEHLHNQPRLRAKTLFATHYHELTELADLLPGVSNYNVAVAEEGAEVTFLYRIVPGGADRSYGIHVAQLAGLPKPVINRAEELLATLEASSGRAIPAAEPRQHQLACIPATSALLQELQILDINTLSPLEALNKLYVWQQRFSGPD